MHPERQREFERAYGAGGDWERLFRNAKGFLGSSLNREVDPHGWYVTIDRWEKREDHANFLQARRADYEDLDRRCKALTWEEQALGSFDTIDAGMAQAE